MTDPFLHALYDRRHDSPMQQRFRRIRPWPVGCVFIQHPTMDEADIRRHFRLMRELGFTALKQCQTCRGTDPHKVMHMAMDEGIIPFWYGEGGWEDPTPEKLTELGIDPATPIEKLRDDPTWLARQEKLMRARIDAWGRTPPPDDPALAVELPGVPLSFDYELTDAHVPLFVSWLQKTYGDIAALNRAWNLHHCMIAGPRRQEGAGIDDEAGWSSWGQLQQELPGVVNDERREYRRIRDVFRFKADIYLDHVRAKAAREHACDPLAPQRAGGEMGLFLPFASRGTDMAGIADVMTHYGSFYPSIHLAWHFEETAFEYARPVYMQASIAADWFKGGWSATWESTGGPQQLTGWDAPFVPAVRDMVPGFTVDGGVMTQLMLSWIAGGFRGFGLWSWSVRSAGWEAGEYGLLDRNNRPTDRAVAAGRIGQACRRLRDELWQARKEPVVGVFVDWDMEAIWAGVSRCSRSMLKSQAVRARIGAARALIDANVPWEHVTADDLRFGLAGRYRVLLLPAALAIAPDLWPIFEQYVHDGGRLVLDAPGGWYDTYGQLQQTDDGSSFERLLGCRAADYQYARAGNRPWAIDGHDLQGCTIDLQPTSAHVVETFDHGPPAVTERRAGRGSAVILAHEASLGCLKPGNAWGQSHLVRHALGEHRSPYRCDGAVAYRLAAPCAEHFFLINDEPRPVTARLHSDRAWGSCTDAVYGDTLPPGESLVIPACSGRWVRCEYAEAPPTV
jgi:beta-galactosidase